MASRTKLLPILVAGGLAVLLAILAVPSLIASLIALPHDGVMERVRLGEQVKPDELEAAAQANALSASIFESARYRSNAAAAILTLKVPQKSAEPLDPEQLVTAALKAAPDSAYNWNRLAFFRAVRGDRRGAEQAWQMSVLTGRYVPGLGRGRMTLAFRMFPISDPTTIDLLVDQVRLTAEANSLDLAWAAHDGQAVPFVRAVLWRDTTFLPKFNRDYAYVVWASGQGAR